MSMISSQCDELRKIADELQNLIDNGHNYTWSGVYRTLHYAQQGLRSAADTIWELHCKLAGVVDQSEEIKRLEDENAKLRELARKFYVCHEHYDCKLCPYREGPCDFDYDMRELGIEVDDDD